MQKINARTIFADCLILIVCLAVMFVGGRYLYDEMNYNRGAIGDHTAYIVQNRNRILDFARMFYDTQVVFNKANNAFEELYETHTVILESHKQLIERLQRQDKAISDLQETVRVLEKAVSAGKTSQQILDEEEKARIKQFMSEHGGYQ